MMQPSKDPASSRGDGGAKPEIASLFPELLRQIPESIAITRTDGTIVFVNRAFEEITGFTESEALGNTPGFLKSGLQDGEFYEAFWSTLLAGETFAGEVINRRKDGSLYVESIRVTPVGEPGPDTRFFVRLGQDVTPQRREYDRLRLIETASQAIAAARDLSEAYLSVLRVVCEHANWCYGEVWEADDTGALHTSVIWHEPDDWLGLFARRSRRVTIRPGEGLPGRVWASARPEWIEDVSAFRSYVRRLIARQAGLRAGFAIPIVAEGRVLAVLSFLARERREDEPDLTTLLTALCSALGALVRRRRAEQQLATERDRLAVTLESIGDGVITTDETGRVERMNTVAEHITGWSEDEARGRPLADVFQIVHEHTRETSPSPVDAVLETGKTAMLANHTMLISKDGEERVIADSAAPIPGERDETSGVVLVFRDETARRSLERETERANRLESLGVLAGGIAHDFNNALAAITAHIGLARMDLREDSETYQTLKEAEEACMRAASLSGQLLAFAKGGMSVRRPIEVGSLVRTAATFAATGSRSRCEFNFAPDVPHVLADEGQLTHAIHNLVLNAVQAMPAGGLVTIGTQLVQVEESSDPGILPGPGDYVRISITDNGPGIAPEQQDRIFEPYFTTKEKGTGLGLSVAYSVARNHDGCLTLDSMPGMGATFHFYLPVSAARALPDAGVQHESPGRSLRVLLMDDEPSIREGMGRILERNGHDVVVAADGDEAVRRYKESLDRGMRWDVVVLDLVVPGSIGGLEAFRRIRELDPKVCAIASSGYSTDPVISHHEDFGFAAALPKPYAPHDLESVLARVTATNGGAQDPGA